MNKNENKIRDYQYIKYNTYISEKVKTIVMIFLPFLIN